MVAIHPVSLHPNIQLIVYESKPWGTLRNWDPSPYITEKYWRKDKIKSSYTEDECQWPHWSLDLSLSHLHPVLFPFAFLQEMCICLYIWTIYKHKLPAVCWQGSYDDAELSLQTKQGWRDIRSPQNSACSSFSPAPLHSAVGRIPTPLQCDN